MARKLHQLMKQEDWLEQFNKQFVEFYPGDSGLGGNDPQEPDEVIQAYPHEIREYIQSLLDQQKQELLEKIKITEGWKPDPKDPRPVYENSDTHFWRGYNQAISNLEQLKKSLNE